MKKCVKIINTLLSSGNDEDAHYWWGYQSISGKDILDCIENQEHVDKLMNELRPIILEWLKITADDYIKTEEKMVENNSRAKKS